MNNAKITGTVTKEITVRGDVKHTYISSGGGSGVSIGNSLELASIAGNHFLGNAGGSYPLNLWNYWQETNDDLKTTATVTATPTAPCLLIAAAMCRDEVSIDGDGWTKIQTLDIEEQKIVVWTKPVSAGTYSVTVNQNSSVRLSLKVICIYRCSSISLIDDNLISSFPYVPSESNGKRRLYLISSQYKGDSNAITVTDSGNIDLRSAVEGRFSAFYDYQPELKTTPIFGVNLSDYNTNTANALTFDIEEE